MAYSAQIEQAERRQLLAVSGVEKDVRDTLDEPLGVRGWPLPGHHPRPAAAAVGVREAGAPAWWAGDDDAAAATAAAMGVRL